MIHINSQIINHCNIIKDLNTVAIFVRLISAEQQNSHRGLNIVVINGKNITVSQVWFYRLIALKQNFRNRDVSICAENKSGSYFISVFVTVQRL